LEEGSLITPLRPEDIESAADLHMCYLTERLSGEPGRRLLRLYYASLCQGSKGTCLVCRDEGGNNLDGMVVLRWNGQRLLWDLLRQHPVEVGFWLAWHILQHPLSLYYLARQLWERRPVNNLLRRLADHPRWCILHALVVVPDRRGGGRYQTGPGGILRGPGPRLWVHVHLRLRNKPGGQPPLRKGGLHVVAHYL